MTRPPLEVADLIREAGTAFLAHSRKWFTWLHLKILTAIVCCRTSALGGHIDECSSCGNTRSVIWAATRIAWPFPITDWSHSKMDRSLFVGATRRTRTRSA